MANWEGEIPKNLSQETYLLLVPYKRVSSREREVENANKEFVVHRNEGVLKYVAAKRKLCQMLAELSPACRQSGSAATFRTIE